MLSQLVQRELMISIFDIEAEQERNKKKQKAHMSMFRKGNIQRGPRPCSGPEPKGGCPDNKTVASNKKWCFACYQKVAAKFEMDRQETLDKELASR